MPEISLIIPVYNCQDILGGTFRHVINQNYTDYEVILVDDGSTDGSGEVCDRIVSEDSRFRVFHQYNSGASSARNRGIAESVGRWIVFMDADDEIGAEYLSTLYAARRENGVAVGGFYEREGEVTRLSVDFSVGDYYANDGTLSLLMNNALLLTHPSPIAKIFDGELIRRRNIRFNPKISLCEDLIFWMEFLVHAESVKLIPPVDYTYLKDNSTLTKKNHSFNSHKELAEEFIRLNGIISERLNEEPAAEALRHEAILVMNAAMALYNGTETRSERLKILRELRSCHYLRLKDYYVCATSVMRVKKWLFLHLLPIFDFMQSVR